MKDEIKEDLQLGFLPPPTLDEEPKQFLGGTLPYEERLPDGNWRKYHSKFEDQHHGVDKLDCVSESCTNVVEEQINWMIKTGQIETEPIKEWLDENGLFESSQRGLAKVSNTTTSGNTQMRVGDALRKFGLIPEKDWKTPTYNDYMSWNEFYKPIPQELIDKGKILFDYFDFAFERLNDTRHETLIKHKKQAPLWIATSTCSGWNYSDIVQMCSASPNHATTLDGHEINKYWNDLDHYNPYEKKLAWNYKIYYPYKLVVTPKPLILKKKENMQIKINVVKKANSPDYLYEDKRNPGQYIRFGNTETFLSQVEEFYPEIEEKDIDDKDIKSPLYLVGSVITIILNILTNLKGKK